MVRVLPKAAENKERWRRNGENCGWEEGDEHMTVALLPLVGQSSGWY